MKNPSSFFLIDPQLAYFIRADAAGDSLLEEMMSDMQGV